MPHPHILHMITPLKHMSPFDVNMALDAGFDAVVPYTQVTLEEVRGLVQDAIFSRSPTDAARTGLFIAGKSASLALDMAKAAADAMVGPFRLSVFADPAGSFTTAAALVAVVERALAGHGRALKDVAVAVLGATGVVGYSAGVIAALEGARVTLVGYDGAARVAAAADEMKARFGIDVAAADGSTAEKKAAVLAGVDVAFAAAAAGKQVLSTAELAAAGHLLVAADVNAVPPAGIEGLALDTRGAEIPGTGVAGIGPLAIGDVKYRTEAGLFRRMIETDEVLALDFRDAFALARKLAA